MLYIYVCLYNTNVDLIRLNTRRLPPETEPNLARKCNYTVRGLSILIHIT